MGSIFKPALTAGGFALGGPVGGGLAGFGSALLGGEGLLGATKGAIGGATLPGTGATAGQRFSSALGFGKDRFKNIATGVNLGLSALPPPIETSPIQFLTPRTNLLDILRSRRLY